MDTGELTFEQSVEALNQLYADADAGQRFVLRLMVLYSFNDIIRKDVKPKPNDTQIAIFTDNCRQMIAMKKTKDTLKAELFREIGEFDMCIDVLNNSSRCSSYEAKVRQQILGFASEHDASVRPLPRFQDEEDNETSDKEHQPKGFLDRLRDLIFDLFE